MPSGSRMRPSAIVLRSDPSGFIATTRPALKSRKNNLDSMLVTPSCRLMRCSPTLGQEHHERLSRFCRAHALRELLHLELHRLLELLAQSPPQEPLASLQR